MLDYGQLMVHQDCRSFSEELLSSCLAPVMYGCQGLFLPMCRAWHCPVLTSWGSCLPISLACWGISKWQHTDGGVSSVNLLRLHSVLSSRSLMKMWNSTGCSMDVWGTPLVTGFQLDFVLLITTVWASFQSISLSAQLFYDSSFWTWGCYRRESWNPRSG